MRAKPITHQKIKSSDETSCPKNSEVDAGDLFPKKVVEQPAKREDDKPEFVWIGFHKFSIFAIVGSKVFCEHTAALLAESIKRYQVHAIARKALLTKQAHK